MKTKKPNLRNKVKEETNIKKELTRWWDTLGLKIMYFNNALELKQESTEDEKLIKEWMDKYELKQKDNHLLQEHIQDLNIKLEQQKVYIKARYKKRICNLVDLAASKDNEIEELNKTLNSQNVVIKTLMEEIEELRKKKINFTLTEDNLDEFKLWCSGQTAALRMLRKTKAKESKNERN